MVAKHNKAPIPLLDALFQKADIKPEAAQMPKQNWSELDALYEVNATSIVEVASNVNNAIRAITEHGVSQTSELKATINGFTRDIQQYTTDLLHIQSHHKSKEGVIKNGADLVLFLSISEDYIALSERFRANTFNVMLTVTEYLSEANSNKAARDAEKELLDPTVISDVEVKETPNV